MHRWRWYTFEISANATFVASKDIWDEEPANAASILQLVASESLLLCDLVMACI
jgi:hypothetical protein